jgi:pyruvate/2-oxoglutarate dehydrogenase complex dihydrolipoamide dehydrogenase (E3) component
LLPRAEPAASEIVQRQFEQEGIRLHLNATVARAELVSGGKRVVMRQNGREANIDGDEILVAIGRTPNAERLNLPAAGVEQNARGVIVNDFLQTANPRIYAAGDIAGSYQFTHAADAMARICLRNALFFGRARLSQLVVPNCTYTQPEVAELGLTAGQAAEANIAIDTYRQDLSAVDRAILDGETNGFAMIHTRKGTAKIVGATIVAAHAGEMIGEVSLMMTKGIPLSALAETIHAYPTQVETLKRLGDAYNKTKLTPFVAGLFKRLLAWRR